MEDDINRQALVDNLWKVMSKNDLGIAEFSRRIGVKDTNVSNWLHMHNVLSLKSVKLIHDEFDVSYDELLKGI